MKPQAAKSGHPTADFWKKYAQGKQAHSQASNTNGERLLAFIKLLL